MKQIAQEMLETYVDARRPMIYINHFDAAVVDDMLRCVAHGASVVEYNNAFGLVDFDDKHTVEECDLERFLNLTYEDGFERQTFLLLRDVSGELSDAKISALLKRISELILHNDDYQCTVFIADSRMVIPPVLEHYITLVDLPLPEEKEIAAMIRDFAGELDIEVEDDTVDEVALSLRGLNEFQIQQILYLAYQNGGGIDKEDKQLILKEKEQFIKKSGMLELVNFRETVDDIGGLDVLKTWLCQKEQIFKHLSDAINFGVDVPKGIMIIGMPGCGKSLTAKATAAQFGLPLVRLDVGRLLGKYVGESEENMRKALRLAEAISPCVLWIDEIEKAFSGVGAKGGNDVTTRLFGQFLTWMQEKESTVFIVATANDISSIPPEFLRKGRFDELFFVDLPNRTEREQILRIHLKKRQKRRGWARRINVAGLAAETEGYNGADLEAVIKEAIEREFSQALEIDPKDPSSAETLSDDKIRAVIKETKSISQTLGKKIEEIRKSVSAMDIRSASAKE